MLVCAPPCAPCAPPSPATPQAAAAALLERLLETTDEESLLNPMAGKQDDKKKKWSVSVGARVWGGMVVVWGRGRG